MYTLKYCRNSFVPPRWCREHDGLPSQQPVDGRRGGECTHSRVDSDGNVVETLSLIPHVWNEERTAGVYRLQTTNHKSRVPSFNKLPDGSRGDQIWKGKWGCKDS